MDFGRIARADAKITEEEWNSVIEAHPNLSPVPDRVGRNPFTDEKIVFRGGGKAYYAEGNNLVGNAVLEHGEVLTTGVPYDFCVELAELLKADVYEDDRT